MKFIDAIQFKDEDFEETVATIHEWIRHLGKAGWTKCDEMEINGCVSTTKPEKYGVQI